MAELPVSNLINVAINLTASPAQVQNLQSMLVLGSSGVIDSVELVRTYSTLTAVATDFGTNSPEYLASTKWFGQSPQPKEILIGQWNKTAVSGRLTGASLPSTSLLMSAWTGITAGSFKIKINAGALTDITGLNFSGATNLNGVATIITTALTGAVCTYDAVYKRFVIKSTTTGATSAISFLTPAATGVDISELLAMTSTSSGAYVANGSIAQSAIDTVVTMDDSFGQSWYGLFIAGASNNDHLAVSAFIEGSNTKHAYAVNTQEAGVLTSNDTSNIAYQLKQLGYKKTATQYSSSDLYAVVSLFARILTTDYNANKTVITLMYKQEPSVVAESLAQTQMVNLLANNCNVFVKYNNNTSIIQPGVVANGDFIDTIFGSDWLAITVQNTLYNLLYSNTTKIPQTNEGHNVLATGIAQVLEQSVDNGLIAPGQWNATGFGALKQFDYLPTGFYIYFKNVDLQNPADRAARKSVPFQVAAKLAGAIHTVDVIINIDR